jgi:hypothetical protein
MNEELIKALDTLKRLCTQQGRDSGRLDYVGLFASDGKCVSDLEIAAVEAAVGALFEQKREGCGEATGGGAKD